VLKNRKTGTYNKVIRYEDFRQVLWLAYQPNGKTSSLIEFHDETVEIHLEKRFAFSMKSLVIKFRIPYFAPIKNCSSQ